MADNVKTTVEWLLFASAQRETDRELIEKFKKSGLPGSVISVSPIDDLKLILREWSPRGAVRETEKMTDPVAIKGFLERQIEKRSQYQQLM